MNLANLLVLALAAAPAQDTALPQASSTTAPQGAGLRLTSSGLAPAPQGDGRFRVQARLAPVETEGELRESPRFSALGRWAKAGVACGLDKDIFRNGFED